MESEWPFICSTSIMLLVYGLLNWFYEGGFLIVFIGLAFLTYSCYGWWDQVYDEVCEQTNDIERGLKIGMVLFIVSEIMFFFSFFWAFFDVSVAPGIEIGGLWPPIGLRELTINAWDVPFLNTVLLLSSGVSVTAAHHCFLWVFDNKLDVQAIKSIAFVFNGVHSIKKKYSRKYVLLTLIRHKLRVEFELLGLWFMLITLILAVMFTLYQFGEYVESEITIADGVYGSTFFLLTGFHGLHVLVGTTFLTIVFCRIIFTNVVSKPSVGLECAIWYWHFVDVVWLLLFLSIYILGNNSTGQSEIDISSTRRALVYNYSWSDAPQFWSLMFQDPSTPTMEGVIDLHHNIMVLVVFLIVLIAWFMLDSTYNIMGICLRTSKCLELFLESNCNKKNFEGIFKSTSKTAKKIVQNLSSKKVIIHEAVISQDKKNFKPIKNSKFK
jgi:cytochrome c oxidase subunit 3